MTEQTYTDCGAVPSEPGCGTCDVCWVTGETDRQMPAALPDQGTIVLSTRPIG